MANELTQPEHKHRWAADRTLVGQSCMDCQASGWDWHVDEVRRLRAIVKAQDEAVKAARAFWTHYQRGQPGTRDSLYPMTHAALDAWHEEWDRLLADMGASLDAAAAAEKR